MSHALALVAVKMNGKTIEDAVLEQMSPFDESGEWFKSGSRWDWWQIGGRFSGRFGGPLYVTRSEITFESLNEIARRRLEQRWDEFERSDAGKSSGLRELLIGPGKTKQEFVERGIPWSAWAFVSNRRWNERERMGWFGGSTPTECERTGKEHVKRCRSKVGDAEVLTWNDDEETWKKKFWSRFIEPLEPDTTLVLVDYHV